MGREAKLYDIRGKKTETEVHNTEVIVIGNGPSGISLSYILSGHWPYYNGENHPDEMLQCRLESLCSQSILEEDLEPLSDGLEGRTHRPVALLMDALLHPGADGGLDLPSLLSWQHSPDHLVPHVVLGKTDVGGAWQAMEDDFLTLSLSNWMELADFPFRTWQAEHRKGDDVEPMHGSRIRVREARQYYLDFVAAKGLSQFIRSHTTVTSVERVAQTRLHIDQESGESTGPTSNSNMLWEVRGYETSKDGKRMEFCYRAPNVVVATGTFDAPNRLGVTGEDSDYVLHSLSELEKAIQCGRVTPDSDPIVVIGAGLSAADAILQARKHGIPVVHAFHRSAKDPQIILSKLPDQLYPEYHDVHQMMKGLVEVDGYCSFECSSVVSFSHSRRVILRTGTQTEKKVIQASFAVVLIGTRPQLSYLPDNGKGLGIVPNMPIHPRHNPINADPYTYQSMVEPGLFAMGPLVGENFVRHLQGGSLGIAAHLWKVKLGKL